MERFHPNIGFLGGVSGGAARRAHSSGGISGGEEWEAGDDQDMSHEGRPSCVKAPLMSGSPSARARKKKAAAAAAAARSSSQQRPLQQPPPPQPKPPTAAPVVQPAPLQAWARPERRGESPAPTRPQQQQLPQQSASRRGTSPQPRTPPRSHRQRLGEAQPSLESRNQTSPQHHQQQQAAVSEARVLGDCSGDLDAQKDEYSKTLAAMIEGIASAIALSRPGGTSQPSLRPPDGYESTLGGAAADPFSSTGRLRSAVISLEYQMKCNPAAIEQLDDVTIASLLDLIVVVVDLASLTDADKHRLTAMVQGNRSGAHQQAACGNPAGAYAAPVPTPAPLPTSAAAGPLAAPAPASGEAAAALATGSSSSSAAVVLNGSGASMTNLAVAGGERSERGPRPAVPASQSALQSAALSSSSTAPSASAAAAPQVRKPAREAAPAVSPIVIHSSAESARPAAASAAATASGTPKAAASASVATKSGTVRVATKSPTARSSGVLSMAPPSTSRSVYPTYGMGETLPVSLCVAGPSQPPPLLSGVQARSTQAVPASACVIAPELAGNGGIAGAGRERLQTGEASTTSRRASVDLSPQLQEELQPWLDAAAEFELSTDFDVCDAVRDRPNIDLPSLLQVMKDESTGKRTIQALSDKIMLHRMVRNMGIPQMPVYMAVERSVRAQDVESLVMTHMSGSRLSEVILKPTHLSNGSGVVTLSTPKPHERQPTIDYLVGHIGKFLAQKADAKESVALRSLHPGFVAQPKYKSVISFKLPLELRVQVLWGRARLALWWWGRGVPESTRNAWFVRRPGKRGGKLDFRNDSWEVVHEHPGGNPGFSMALEIFRRHIREMSASAEGLAAAVGAPFLRADFFVGSPEYGVRLNEVAYGCGADYRSTVPDETAPGGVRIVDDAPSVAYILREGMSRCKRKFAPDRFLRRLGVTGTSYADMAISDVLVSLRPPLPEGSLREGCGTQCEDFAVPEEQCATPRTAARRPPAAMAAAAAAAAIGVAAEAARPALLIRRGGDGGVKVRAAPATATSCDPSGKVVKPSKSATVKSFKVVKGSTSTPPLKSGWKEKVACSSPIVRRRASIDSCPVYAGGVGLGEVRQTVFIN
eukprot:TRINITY_DN4658_c0_g1_i1.p1 TRINITY_DN4658_c0_g1~~TRINITY_DN4658_c0_g1_i1.p1  ORF type:complete len:1246 (+),score=260.99 TRINITY_DN4658_c0_g1_i1:426-3740(+)